MGSKTKTTQDPWAPAQPFILQGLQNSGRVFDTTQPALEGFAGDQRATYGRVAPGAEAGITSAQALTNRVLSGQTRGQNPGAMTIAANMTPRRTNDFAGAVRPSLDYYGKTMAGGFMGGNPFLDSSINYAIDDANDAGNSAFSSAGRYGSGAHQGVLAREAGRISANARMGAYEAERGRMDSAAGAFGGMNMAAVGADEEARRAADNDALAAAGMADQNYRLDQGQEQQAIGNSQDLMRGSQSILDSAAQMPWYGVGALNGNVRQASNGYGTTTKTEGGFGQVLSGIRGGLGLAGQIGGAALAFSEPGMKKDVKPLGVRPDGLGVYAFKYRKGAGMPGGEQVGVMADEVEALRPDALGPQIGGNRTVDYGRLDAPMPMQSPMLSLYQGADGKQQPIQPQAPAAAPVGAMATAAKKRGLFTRLAEDPTLSSPENVKRAIGVRLMAAGGNPLGEALLSQMDDAAKREQQQVQNEMAQTRLAVAALPDAEKEPEPFALLKGMGLNPSTGEGLDLMRGYFGKRVGGGAGGKALRTVAGVGLVEYDPATGESRVVQGARAPARVGGAPARTPPKYQLGPNGQMMKWVP